MEKLPQRPQARHDTANPSKEARVTELERLIKKHQHLYYNAQPELSDEDFDMLWKELEDIDPENGLLAGIGADAADGWPKARHIMPMGSQAKASDPEAFQAWADKQESKQFIVQYKLDGASIELQYEKGSFVRALTRGDGTIGDDITPNVLRMNGLPRFLPDAFSGGVRGEVLMSHAVHAANYADKANCRNAANGLMKRKDGAGASDLDIICYDAAGSLASPVAFADEYEKMNWLKYTGFTVVEFVLLDSAAAVIDYRGKVMDLRESLPYDIDGLVVKGLTIDPADMARARPEKQIAFKFSLEEAVTTLRAVEWSESGASYTPVGIMDPVRLAGTTVKRASLCNPGLLRALDLRIGSRLVITKRGEIIPKIESLVANPPDSQPILFPNQCSCGTALVDEGTRLFCPNPLCPKKDLHRLEKWLNVLGILDFGSTIVGRLHAAGRVRSIVDLYSLTVEELAAFDRMGDRLARKLLRNLHARSEVSLSEFVAGFDIENVGVLVVDKLLAAGFDRLDKLFAASVQELDEAEGVAEIMARTIADGLAFLRADMEALLATGAVRIREPPSSRPDVAAPGLAGKSVCFTGELSSIKRTEAQRLVREAGGMVKSSVTKDLDYLVSNDPASGSEKNRNAQALGLAIIDEATFLSMLART